MKFDKTRVCTTFNCDDVKIGSKGYFADNKEDLISRVQFETKAYYDTFDKINTHTNDYVFATPQGSTYRYFYPVEEPKEPTKRPCTRKELLEMLKKQGLSMIICKDNSFTYSIIRLNEEYIAVISVQGSHLVYDYMELCETFTLLDGSELWIEE